MTKGFVALGTGMSLQMDVGDLAPELGYLGVPGLGDYAYTHWEWGQFLRALTRGPAASTPFLSSLSFCMVATEQTPQVLWVGPCCIRCCVFLGPQSSVYLFWSSVPSPPAVTILAFGLDEFCDPHATSPSKLME